MGVALTEERRREARTEMGSTRATVRPGCEVAVIDLSPGGALVETQRPLRPGARVHMQIAACGRTIALTAHILRCAVWSLDAAEGILYRGALQFERRCHCFRQPALSHEAAWAAAPGDEPGDCAVSLAGAGAPAGDA